MRLWIEERILLDLRCFWENILFQKTFSHHHHLQQKKKYKEIKSLIQANPWSPNLNDNRLRYIQKDIFRFDSVPSQFQPSHQIFSNVVIDPPKSRLMYHIYSAPYLFKLSEVMQENAVIAAYVPEGGISEKYQQFRNDIVPVFESTKRYKFVGNYRNKDGTPESSILCFKRVLYWREKKQPNKKISEKILEEKKNEEEKRPGEFFFWTSKYSINWFNRMH